MCKAMWIEHKVNFSSTEYIFLARPVHSDKKIIIIKIIFINRGQDGDMIV